MSDKDKIGSALKGVVMAVVLGSQLLIFELTATITLYFESLHTLLPDEHPQVLESHVVDFFMTSLVANLAAGAFISLVYLMLGKTENTESYILCLAFAGLFVFTLGNFIVSWQRPNWPTLGLIQLGLISPGGGIVVWGCLLLLNKNNTWLWAPFLFALLFYPSLHSIVSSPLSRNEFHYFHLNLAWVCTPLLVLFGALVVYSFYRPFEFGKSRGLDNVLFLLPAKAVFLPVFVSSLIYSNYIYHLKGLDTGLHLDGPPLGYSNPDVEANVILWTAVARLVGGVLAGILLKLKVSKTQLALRILLNLGSVGVAGGWHALVLTRENKGLGEHAALSFFMGLTFTYSMFVSLTPMLKREFVGPILLCVLCAVLSTLRKSTGFFGSWSSVNFVLLTQTLSVLSACAAGLDFASCYYVFKRKSFFS